MRKKPQSESESQAAPASLDTERAILGAIVLDVNILYGMQSLGLKPEHFHFDSNRRIYRVIEFICSEHRLFDIRILCEELSKRNELESVGDVAYVSSLIDGVPDRALDYQGVMQAYFGILHEHYLRRRVIDIAKRATDCAHDPSDPVKWTMAGIHEDILRLQGDTSNGEITQVKDFSGELLSRVEKMMHLAPDQTVGIPFGLAELDETTTGMREGQLIVLGGFPKSGKTSFAIDVSRKNAKAGVPIVFFSREMLKEELLERVWAQESGISYFKIRKPAHLAISEFRLLEQTRKKVDAWPLFVDDKVLDISELIPRAHLMIRKYGARLIVLDYLQILHAPGEKPYERVTNAINQLTDLAKQTKTPVLCLSQLTRSGNDKKDLNTIPNMAMLRESGQIEMNAHLILFSYHPVDTNTMDPTGDDLVVIGAQRAGPTGHIKAFFDVQIQTWNEREVPTPSTQKEIFK